MPFVTYEDIINVKGEAMEYCMRRVHGEISVAEHHPFINSPVLSFLSTWTPRTADARVVCLPNCGVIFLPMNIYTCLSLRHVCVNMSYVVCYSL